MGKRGRRPHPDILTPREWEVLDLLRERLTNEQIADRLGITRDGAKYHVSQILSKLGVATREKAALWRPPERRRWWQRLIALPVAAKLVGTVTLVAAGVGLAVLAWSVLTTETNDDIAVTWEPPALPEPQQAPRLTRDQALLRGAQRGQGDISFVDARPSEMGAILRYLDGPLPPEIPELTGRRSTETAWLVTTLGEFAQPDAGPPTASGVQPTFVPEIACREVTVVFRDDANQTDPTNGPDSSYSVSNPLSDTTCTRAAELTRDLAIVYGARALDDYLTPSLASLGSNFPFPRDVPAERTILGEAVDMIRREGVLGWMGIQVGDANDPVWLLRFQGPFSYSPQTTRGVSVAAVCTEVIVIIHAETGQPLLTRSKQRDDC